MCVHKRHSVIRVLFVLQLCIYPHSYRSFTGAYEVPMPAKDTDDPLVAGTVDYLTLPHVVNETYTTTNAEHLLQQGVPGSFMMNTTRRPDDEEFFVTYVICQ